MWKKLFIFIILFVAILYFLDFGFLKGEITKYPLNCNKKNYVNYQCTEKWLPLNPTTYKPNANKQQVLYWAFSDIQTLTKCSVVDRENWTCKYSDESAEFGFKNGQFWEIALDKNNVWDKLFETRYVSKFIYRLEGMKWL